MKSLYPIEGVVPLYLKKNVSTNKPLMGPALICEEHTSIVIEKGWEANLTSYGEWILKRKTQQNQYGLSSAIEPDPVYIELFNQRFMAIAVEMGDVLQKTSQSINIKERLDFSCAVFNRDGDLIANAPHMPVHIGSMSESVKSIIDKRKNNLKQGDVYMSNSPYEGGTHLPDITVITPIFIQGDLKFFTASRGHHADVGGQVSRFDAL